MTRCSQSAPRHVAARELRRRHAKLSQLPLDTVSGLEVTSVSCVFVQAIFDKVKARDPDQKEFLQAVEEVLTTLEPVLKKRPELVPVVERLCEPERQLLFRVPWWGF